MVRLADIAKAAGVTTMTASRALRNTPHVAAATRHRIQQLAKQMGYVPDFTARSLRTRSQQLLGLIVPNLDDPVFSRLMASINDRALEAGYDLLIAQSMGQIEREQKAVRHFLARRVDAMMIAPVFRPAHKVELYEELQQRGVKVLVMGAPPAFAGAFPYLEPDDIEGARQATLHLVGLGHRRICYLAGPPVQCTSLRRFEGFRKALRESGLDVRDELVFSAGWSIADGEHAALLMLQERANPTAILAAHDWAAVGAARTLLRQGLRVPEDISIVGFGNTPLAENFGIPLTTVRQPKTSWGELAVETVLRMIQGEKVPSRSIPTELLVRESTSAPAKAPAA